MRDIKELRKRLDSIDDELVRLLAERTETVKEVGLYKKSSGFPLNDPGREASIIERLTDKAPLIAKEYIPGIMTAVFAASKKLQAKLKGDYYVIGRKLPHTWSPDIYIPLGLDYKVKELDTEEDVKRFAAEKNYAGFNVTIPYKQTVMPLLDEISEEARAVGAVNTVVNRGGRLYGYNTDVGGMTGAMKRAGIDPRGKVAAVLGGSGGTAKTAKYVLEKAGAREILSVSRTGEINYKNIASYPVEIIINATPVGMYPDILSSPVALSAFPRLKGVFDAVYNPMETVLVSEAKKAGIPSANGLYMLVEQGRLSYNLYMDTETSETVSRILEKKIRAAKSDIVLIGMPGSGKTSIGAMVAEMCGRTFIDTDAEVEKAAGKSIPEIFAESGEAAFRELESKIIAEVSASSGAVIATGGGAVLSEKNRLALKRNGVAVYIKRDLNDLSSEGRPLSAALGAEKLYAERAAVYEAFADVEVENKDIVSAAERVAQIAENGWELK